MAVLIVKSIVGVSEFDDLNHLESDVNIQLVINPILDATKRFTDLVDTPESLDNQDGKLLVVKDEKIETATIADIADSRYVNKTGDVMTGNLSVNNSQDAELQINAGENKDAKLSLTEANKLHGVELIYEGSDASNLIKLNAITKSIRNLVFAITRDGKFISFKARPQFAGINILNQTENDARYVKHTEVVNSLGSTATTNPLSAMQGKLLNDRKAAKRSPSDYGTGTTNAGTVLHGDGSWKPITLLTSDVLNGTLAKRPAPSASNKGDFYVVTGDSAANNGQMFLSDGKQWISVEHPTKSYTKIEADNRFVNVTGDTIKGTLMCDLGGAGAARLTGSSSMGYIQAGIADTKKDQVMQITGISGVPLKKANFNAVNSQSITINDKKIYNEGFKPTLDQLTGTAANANNLDGKDLANSATPNTVVGRDPSGDINARLFRSSYTDQNTMKGAIAYRISTTDNYIRYCNSPAAVRSWLSTLSTADFDKRYFKIPNPDYRITKVGNDLCTDYKQGAAWQRHKFLDAGRFGHEWQVSGDSGKTWRSLLKVSGSDAQGTGDPKAEFNAKIYQDGVMLDTKYLGAKAKAVNSNQLDGRTRSQIIAEARQNIVTTQTGDGRYVKKAGDTMTGILNINTPTGKLGIGSKNTSWIHFESDRSFYFNKSISAVGDLKVYNRDTMLRGSDGLILENGALLQNKYLGKTAKAADADKLDGKNSTDFVGVKKLANNTDMNKLLVDGHYRHEDKIINGPKFDTRYGQTIVSHGERSDTTLQITGNYQSKNIAWRGFNNTFSSGGTWNEFYHTGHKPTAADVKALSTDHLSKRGINDANAADSAGVTANYLTTSAKNKPTGSDHSLFTLAYGTTYATQLAGDWRTNKHYVRGQNNGKWSSWAELYSTANKPTAADVGALTQATADGRYINKSLPDHTTNATWYFPTWFNGSKDLYTTKSKLMFRPSDGRFKAGTFETGNWFRTTGNCGWHNDTYGGGIYMKDTTWVRIYNKRKFHLDNTDVDSIYTLGGVKSTKDITQKGKTLDATYLGKTAKAADAQLLDGINSNGFCRAYSASTSFDGTQGDWTTAQFIIFLSAKGAFSQPYWVARGSWSYGANKTIKDTTVGNIHLAGAVVEVMGNGSNYTIRVTTPTTTSNGGLANAQFTYIYNGKDYAPYWRRDYNTKNKPTAADITGTLDFGRI